LRIYVAENEEEEKMKIERLGLREWEKKIRGQKLERRRGSVRLG